MVKPYFNDQISPIINEIIRVNHAGEYGAYQIYQGQLKTNKDPSIAQLLKIMYCQEVEHMNYFIEQMKLHQIRPTILLGLWRVLGSALGQVSAKMGSKTAMLCTEAIENVIKDHYEQQIQFLSNFPEYQLLKERLEQFQKEEIEHQQLAKEYTYSLNFIDQIAMSFIQKFCKIAILLSRKI